MFGSQADRSERQTLSCGGMAARYRSGYLVSRWRGALSHAEALATEKRLHLELLHIPNLLALRNSHCL